MEAGRLRHRVIVEQVSLTADAMGQGTETWTTYTTLWMDLQPLRGRELIAAQAVNSEITVKAISRYKSGISPTMRLKHGTAIYTILEIVNPGMRNISLEFMAKEQPQSAT